MPFRRLFVTVGWTSTPIAKFSLRAGVAKAQNRAILLMSLIGFLGLSPLITFILISFTFLLLIILRTPHPVFFPWRILSFPLLPGFRCKLNLVAMADLATPRIWWLCLLLICSVLWMVPPFLSFPHIPFLALLGSICLPSVLIIMVAFFQTPMFFPPLFLSHRFCALSKLTVLLALLLFLMSSLVNFGGLFFNHIRLSCWPPRVLRA